MKYLKLAVVIGLIGLTFIYNPQTGSGMVYLNNSAYHGIIIVDTETGQWNYYQGQFIGSEHFFGSLESWLRDKTNGFRPKSFIVPSSKSFERSF